MLCRDRASFVRIAVATAVAADDGHAEKVQSTYGLDIPSDFVLKHVLVLQRHGDRTPITRQLGTVVRDDEPTRAFWTERLARADGLVPLLARHRHGAHREPLAGARLGAVG